jgi:hypothetical protein
MMPNSGYLLDIIEINFMSRKGAKVKNLSGFAPLREKFLFPIFFIFQQWP